MDDGNSDLNGCLKLGDGKAFTNDRIRVVMNMSLFREFQVWSFSYVADP